MVHKPTMDNKLNQMDYSNNKSNHFLIRGIVLIYKYSYKLSMINDLSLVLEYLILYYNNHIKTLEAHFYFLFSTL